MKALLLSINAANLKSLSQAVEIKGALISQAESELRMGRKLR